MRNLITILFISIFCSAFAQETLTLETAINMALKKNYDILVSRNDADIAKANNTAGNAGMLPTVAVTGSGNYALNNVNQKLSNGAENNYPALSATTLSAGAELSWTLFDGGKMFVTKNRLNEIQALGEIQFKEKVLQTQYNIISSYYNIVRLKQQLQSINEVIKYNRERVKITETGFNSGYYIKSDLLQSKIDLNVALENAINQQYAIDATKKNLNYLLGRDSDTDFEVTDFIPLNYHPDIQGLFSKLNSLNTGILYYQKQIDIAQQTVKENQSYYLPKVNFRAGYYASQTINSAGTTLENRSLGPQIGGSVSIPLFSAGENKRKTTTAKIELQSAKFNLDNVKLQTSTDLKNALSDFENQQKLMLIEKENYELAKENLEISIQRLRLGQTTTLEVHLAQEDFVQSFTRLIDFEYNLKMAESNLKQLVSSL